ncbi:MAG: aminomethyl transferase family protein, partial [Planctomycetes bacterium]|nr:aminomethyl transferase family protein [Planctomycetota bacterium]
AFLIDAEPSVAARLPAELEKYVVADDVQIGDESTRFAELSLQGPDAARILGDATGIDVASLEPDAVREHDLLGSAGIVRRADLFGVAGFDVWIATEKTAELFDGLRSRGARPAGFVAWETLRIESGVPRFGADIDEDSLPPEVGLEGAISYTKGCYVGQETIARVKYQGHVNRQLVSVTISTPTPPPRFTAIYADDREVGRLTSACWSPARQAVIGLAIVRRESSEPGTALHLRLDSGVHVCTVTRTEPGTTPADFSPHRGQGSRESSR